MTIVLNSLKTKKKVEALEQGRKEARGRKKGTVLGLRKKPLWEVQNLLLLRSRSFFSTRLIVSFGLHRRSFSTVTTAEEPSPYSIAESLDELPNNIRALHARMQDRHILELLVNE